MDHLATLGLGPGATQAEVRRAYLRLARECHPDCNADPAAHERFLGVRAAYEALTGQPTVRRVPPPPPPPRTPMEILAAARAAFARELQRSGIAVAPVRGRPRRQGMRIVMTIV